MNKIEASKGCARQYTQHRSGALHLTQKIDYGILLLAALAVNNDSADKNTSKSIKDIATEKDASFSFLQKVAGELQKANLIIAERGKYGGYKLTKAPQDIKLIEVIEALEGKIAVVPCLNTETSRLCARTEQCKIRAGLAKLNSEIQEYFLSITLNYFTK